jgi:hypothetical protein
MTSNLMYARSLRDKLIDKFELRNTREREILISFRDFLDIRHRLIPKTVPCCWTSYLLIEHTASDDLIRKLEVLTGPHGHTYYKALVARGILSALKNSPVV